MRSCEPTATPADEAGSTVSSASREDTVVGAGRVATSYGRAGSGHVPSMTTNVGSPLVVARSHVVRDPPSIKTCAPGQRLWPDLGLRHMPEASQEATEDARRGFGPARPARGLALGRVVAGGTPTDFAATHRMTAGSPTKRVLQGQRGRRGSAQVVDQHGEGHRLARLARDREHGAPTPSSGPRADRRQNRMRSGSD